MSRHHPHASGSKPAISQEIMNVESWVPPLTEIIDVDAWQPNSSSSTVVAYNQLFVNGIPQEALNTADNNFTCSICQQFLANAVSLPCGKTICHIFCFYCLHHWLYESQGKGCPLCCTEIKNPPTYIKNLEAVLKSLPSYKNNRAKVVWNKV
ncbi:hypothetical protein B0H14DRAFT_2654421 [Mycena olivaceomarginata]|nr:hypothetical protein B0H14DRAFT_2654421 [Mycena olivaceomarginata]